MSRIGKKPVGLPAGVTASVSGQTIEVKGPKGTRSFSATDDVTIAVENDAVTVTPRGKSKPHASSGACPAHALLTWLWALLTASKKN